MTIADNLQTIGQRICKAEKSYQRSLNSVQLLAVSKYQPVTALRQAIAAGQYAFGENYAQEMADKAAELQHETLEWHFIGPIQSNKTQQIARIADWVHTIDRFKVAQRLSAQKPAHKPALNVCVQVNLSHEASKSGVTPAEVAPLAEQIQSLPGVKLRGLMAIPAPQQTWHEQRQVFAQLRQLWQDLKHHGFDLDTLSMGMTDDMEAAIAEGATIVRIGTAIFGQRPTKP